MPPDRLQSWLQEREEAKAAISTAIETYNFLEAIDNGSTHLLQAQLGRQKEQAMTRCLLIIFRELPLLMDKADVVETELPTSSSDKD